MTVHDELLIDGQWRKSSSSTRIPVVSPPTDEVIGEVPDAGPEDVDAAVRAARRSFDSGVWRTIGAEVLERALTRLEPRLEEIHRLVTADPEPAADIARRVRSGTFSINGFTHNTEAPFGGVKNSGVGRDTGPEAVHSYYELKTINLTEETAPLFA